MKEAKQAQPTLPKDPVSMKDLRLYHTSTLGVGRSTRLRDGVNGN